MAEKFAIYAGPPLATVLVGYEDARSARVNMICDEYQQLVALLSPELTEPQWQALIDALMSTWLDDEITLRHLWADVQEAEELGEKWGIDQAELVVLLKRMHPAELIALREILRRYRLLDGGHPPAQALRIAGAKLAGAAPTDLSPRRAADD